MKPITVHTATLPKTTKIFQTGIGTGMVWCSPAIIKKASPVGIFIIIESNAKRSWSYDMPSMTVTIPATNP